MKEKLLSTLMISSLLLVGCVNNSEEETEAAEDESIVTEITTKEVAELDDEAEQADKEEEVAADFVQNEVVDESVPEEYRKALEQAQEYIDTMFLSELGLYRQFNLDYTVHFSDEAIEYAVENVNVDYNEEALEAAISHRGNYAYDGEKLYNQLSGNYDGFTEEQAQYAMDNLD